MTKAEIITRIINRMTDPYADPPEDYQYATMFDLAFASQVLAHCRMDDKNYSFDPEDHMPEEATPALVMEAWNCHVRYKKHELRVEQFKKFIIEYEPVCEFDTYYVSEHDSVTPLFPTEFIGEAGTFPFSVYGTHTPDYLSILIIGKNSTNTFKPSDEYCWFDESTMTIHSTNTPFADGVLDAEAFARFILADRETFDYIVNEVMSDDDAVTFFDCSKADLRKEVKL